MSYLKIPQDGNENQVSIYYEVVGTGKPIIFISGWPTSHEMWEYQISEMSEKGYQCISYDRRGFGISDKPSEGYDYDTLASDLKAIIEELNLEKVTLVGFSMGGGEVVRYLANYGENKVDKIVLISSVCPFILKTANNEEGIDKKVFDTMIEEIKKDRPDFLTHWGEDFFGVGMLSKPVTQSFLDYCQSLVLRASTIATQKCVRSFTETDFRNDLMKITIPTLIIHGDSDKIVPIEVSSDRTSEMISHATYIRYNDAPHGLYFTDKDKLNEDLMRFI